MTYRYRSCARCVMSQFQENISVSRENKIYNRNKIHGREIKFTMWKWNPQLRIAKAPTGKCRKTRGKTPYNQSCSASALLRSCETEISQHPFFPGQKSHLIKCNFFIFTKTIFSFIIYKTAHASTCTFPFKFYTCVFYYYHRIREIRHVAKIKLTPAKLARLCSARNVAKLVHSIIFHFDALYGKLNPLCMSWREMLFRVPWK